MTPESTVDPQVEKLTAELAERTADLQRTMADYANYRKRTDRERELFAERGQDRVLLDLVAVLDDIDRAREHGDLTGPFKAVADSLDGVLAKAGVESFGVPGDPFDPSVHEAVAHSESADLPGPTCVAVLRRGYRRGERLLRTAMVAVAEPPATVDTPDENDQPADE